MRIVQISALLLLGVTITAGVVHAQGRVDTRVVGDRLLVVVPMIGSGTLKDPTRPLFMPTPEENQAREAQIRAQKPGTGTTSTNSRILSWRYERSDDGKFALMEITATDQEALKEIKASTRADVKVFEIGKASKDEIEREFRKYKPTFDAGKFGEGKR